MYIIRSSLFQQSIIMSTVLMYIIIITFCGCLNKISTFLCEWILRVCMVFTIIYMKILKWNTPMGRVEIDKFRNLFFFLPLHLSLTHVRLLTSSLALLRKRYYYRLKPKIVYKRRRNLFIHSIQWKEKVDPLYR